MMTAIVTEAKPRQLQVSRIRQEEDESCWISSEELYTDGSSEDEPGNWSGTPKHHHHHHHHSHSSPLHQLLHQHHQHPTSSHATAGGGGGVSPLACKEGASGDAGSLPLGSTRLGAPPPTASEPALQDAPHLTETTRRLSELGVEGMELLQGAASTDAAASADDELEEQEEIMLWRPKRGSLKLPHHIQLTDITPSTPATITACINKSNASVVKTTDTGCINNPCAPVSTSALPVNASTTDDAAKEAAKESSSAKALPKTGPSPLTRKSSLSSLPTTTMASVPEVAAGTEIEPCSKISPVAEIKSEYKDTATVKSSKEETTGTSDDVGKKNLGENDT